MITASLAADGAVTSIPVELLGWSRDGRVRVLRHRMVAGTRVFGVYFSIAAMQLSHVEGRAALARALARLPHAQPEGA
jgi:hypothetical protein